jgi:hypothetical protein
LTGLVTFSPRTPRCLPLTTMANPPAAILGADELLAPLEDGGLGAAYQRASSAGSGSTGRPRTIERTSLAAQEAWIISA